MASQIQRYYVCLSCEQNRRDVLLTRRCRGRQGSNWCNPACWSGGRSDCGTEAYARTDPASREDQQASARRNQDRVDRLRQRNSTNDAMRMKVSFEGRWVPLLICESDVAVGPHE